MDNALSLHRFGGLRVDDAIEEALLASSVRALSAAIAAPNGARERRDQVRDALSRTSNGVAMPPDRLSGIHALTPPNRLVTSELEARWNRALAHRRRSRQDRHA